MWHDGVAVGSIRPRILKVGERACPHQSDLRCSGLDPTEDTESPKLIVRPEPNTEGCSGLDPIEDTERGFHDHPGQPGIQSCSGLDPTEDTERFGDRKDPPARGVLQWARSDRGY